MSCFKDEIQTQTQNSLMPFLKKQPEGNFLYYLQWVGILTARDFIRSTDGVVYLLDAIAGLSPTDMDFRVKNLVI